MAEVCEFLLPIGWDTETTISELSKLTIFEPFLCDSGGAKSVHNCRFWALQSSCLNQFSKIGDLRCCEIAPKEALLLQMLEVVKLQKRISKALPVDWLTFSWQTTPRRSVVTVACSDILKGQRTALESIRLTSKFAYEKPMNDCKSSCSVPSERRLSIHLS